MVLQELLKDLEESRLLLAIFIIMGGVLYTHIRGTASNLPVERVKKIVKKVRKKDSNSE